MENYNLIGKERFKDLKLELKHSLVKQISYLNNKRLNSVILKEYFEIGNQVLKLTKQLNTIIKDEMYV
jgi:hypothetical protein